MWVHQFITLRISLLFLFSVKCTYFLLILIYLIVVVIVRVFALQFIVYSVSFIVCVVLCAVFECGVLFVCCVLL
jgi:hypothetical protein